MAYLKDPYTWPKITRWANDKLSPQLSSCGLVETISRQTVIRWNAYQITALLKQNILKTFWDVCGLRSKFTSGAYFYNTIFEKISRKFSFEKILQSTFLYMYQQLFYFFLYYYLIYFLLFIYLFITFVCCQMLYYYYYYYYSRSCVQFQRNNLCNQQKCLVIYPWEQFRLGPECAPVGTYKRKKKNNIFVWIIVLSACLLKWQIKRKGEKKSPK